MEDESGGGGDGGGRPWDTSVDLGSVMGSGSFEVYAGCGGSEGGGGEGDFSNQRQLHGYLYSGVEVEECDGANGGQGASRVHQCQV